MAGGLLGPIEEQPGGASFFADPRLMGILGIGAGLLQASGPSQQRVSLGQGLGQGLQSGMQFAQQAQGMQQADDLARTRRQLAKIQAAQLAMAGQKMEQEQARQQQVQGIIGQLPPEQRQLAMLDPETFAKRRIEQAFPEALGADKQFRTVGNSLVDITTGKPVYQAPFAPPAPREMWQTIGPDQAQKMGLPAGVYQQSSQGQIRPLQAPTPDLIAVQTPEGARLVPKSQAAGMSPADQREDKTFTQGNQLRSQWNALTKDHREVATAYKKVDEGFKQQTGPGDIAGIFGFMKMLDPTSVVREGEFATAQNSAGVPEYYRSMYNRLLEGDKLGENQRQELKKAAGSQILPYRASFKSLADQYRDIAKRALVNPEDVLTPVDWPEITAPSAPAGAAPAAPYSPKQLEYLRGGR